MSEIKSTPGPFVACDPGDYSDFGGRSIVILGDDMSLRIAVVQGCDEEAKANASLFVASLDMLTALETVLAGGHLNTGEQAIVANAIAKALGKSIDEVLRVGG